MTVTSEGNPLIIILVVVGFGLLLGGLWLLAKKQEKKMKTEGTKVPARAVAVREHEKIVHKTNSEGEKEIERKLFVEVLFQLDAWEDKPARQEIRKWSEHDTQVPREIRHLVFSGFKSTGRLEVGGFAIRQAKPWITLEPPVEVNCWVLGSDTLIEF